MTEKGSIKQALPGKRQPVDYRPYKDLIDKLGPPNFKGSVRGKGIGPEDYPIVIQASFQAYKQGIVDNPKLALTLAATAYWQMWDQRPGA